MNILERERLYRASEDYRSCLKMLASDPILLSVPPGKTVMFTLTQIRSKLIAAEDHLMLFFI